MQVHCQVVSENSKVLFCQVYWAILKLFQRWWWYNNKLLWLFKKPDWLVVCQKSGDNNNQTSPFCTASFPLNKGNLLDPSQCPVFLNYIKIGQVIKALEQTIFRINLSRNWLWDVHAVHVHWDLLQHHPILGILLHFLFLLLKSSLV